MITNQIPTFNGTEILTFPCRQKFDYLAPDPATIKIWDVAWSLCRENRYANHTKIPVTVATHCVLAVLIHDTLCGDNKQDEATQKTRWAICHHDDSEAYTRDLPSPLKKALGPAWKAIEEPIEKACEVAFGVSGDFETWVKQADRLAYFVETEILRPHLGRQDPMIPMELREPSVWRRMEVLLTTNPLPDMSLWTGLVRDIAPHVGRDDLIRELNTFPDDAFRL